MHPVLIPLLFVPFFLGIWLLVSFIISTIGGWSRLAKKYTYDGKSAGMELKAFHMTGMRMNRVANYKNAMYVGIYENGLMLKPVKIFRFRHPTLFIPWTEIDNAEYSKVFFAGAFKCTVDGIAINIFREAGRALNDHFLKR